jgi:outer membrane protein, adhesin transport system
MSKFNFDPEEYELAENDRIREKKKRDILRERIRKKQMDFQPKQQGSVRDGAKATNNGRRRLASIIYLASWSATIGCLGLLTHRAEAQTLHEAVLISLAQYPAILAAQSRVNAAESDIIRAQSGHWPQVGWTGTYNAYQSGNISNNWIQSPTVSLNVWSSGRIQAGVERSKALADSGRQQQRITRDDVALLATEGYLNWAHQLDMVRLAKDNVLQHQRILGSIGQIVAADSGRRIDYSQAQVRMANAELSLKQAMADLAVAQERLNRMLLGRMPDKPAGLDFVVGVNPASAQEALAALNDSHPAISRQIALVSAAQATLKAARSQYGPTVDLTYGKQTAQGSGQGGYLTQVVVSMPIFQGGATYGSVGTAAAELQASEHSLAETRLVLRERVLVSWSEWLSAQSRGKQGAAQAATAKSLVWGYWQQFQVGRRSLLDLLNVQSDLYTYQVNAANANYESTVARARLLAGMGKLANDYTVAASSTSARSYTITTVKNGNGSVTAVQRPSAISTKNGQSYPSWMTEDAGHGLPSQSSKRGVLVTGSLQPLRGLNLEQRN